MQWSEWQIVVHWRIITYDIFICFDACRISLILESVFCVFADHDWDTSYVLVLANWKCWKEAKRYSHIFFQKTWSLKHQSQNLHGQTDEKLRHIFFKINFLIISWQEKSTAGVRLRQSETFGKSSAPEEADSYLISGEKTRKFVEEDGGLSLWPSVTNPGIRRLKSATASFFHENWVFLQFLHLANYEKHHYLSLSLGFLR